MPLVVKGYRDLKRACDLAGKESKRLARDVGLQVGEVVRVDAARRFEGIDARSAAGYRVSVRQAGIFVVQSIRETTGQHPEYGAKQMKDALLPAVSANEDEIGHIWGLGADRICDHFDRH